MKKLAFITIALIILSTSPALAGNKVPAGVNPDSIFYWFDRASEDIELFFTFNNEEKVKALSNFSLERLSEAEAVNDEETIVELLSDFQENQEEAEELAGENPDSLANLSEDESGALDQLTELVESIGEDGQEKAGTAITQAVSRLTRLSTKLEKIAAQGSSNGSEKAAKAVSKAAERLSHIHDKLVKIGEKAESSASKKAAKELTEHVEEATGKHVAILEGVLDKVPDQAKEGILNAISNSTKDKTNSGKAFGKKGSNGDTDDSDVEDDSSENGSKGKSKKASEVND